MTHAEAKAANLKSRRGIEREMGYLLALMFELGWRGSIAGPVCIARRMYAH